MEGLQWMSLIAFPSETKSSLEWSGSENRNLFSWCCEFCCFPLCCSFLLVQAYKTRETLGTRTKCEGWLMIHQPSVNVLITRVLWLHRRIWKCSWIEQCLNDGWEKGGNKTFSPVWCFRDLLLSEKCCACLISEDVFHPHHHPYSLGYGDARKMGGEKRVPWEYSQADVYKVKKPQLRALQQSCFETCGFLSVQLVGKMKMVLLICWPNHLAETSMGIYIAQSLVSVCGQGKTFLCAVQKHFTLLSWGRRADSLLCTRI